MNFKIVFMTAMGILQFVNGAPADKPQTSSGCLQERIFVATSDGSRSSLAVSIDGGKTWAIRDPAPASAAITYIHASGDNVIVGALTGVAKSTNGGHTWVFHSPKSVDDFYNVTSVFVSGDRIIFGCNVGKKWPSGKYFHGVLSVSNDLGKTWPIEKSVQDELVIIEEDYAPLSAVYAIGNRSFIGFNHPVDGGIRITDDDGSTWRSIDAAHGSPGSGQITSFSGFGDNIFASLDRDGGFIAISEDKGDSWGTQQTVPTGSGSGANSVYAADGKVYVATNGRGLAISSSWWDKWEVKNASADGLISDTITAVIAVEHIVVVGTPVGLSISADGGSTWVSKTTKDGLVHNNVTAIFVQCAQQNSQ